MKKIFLLAACLALSACYRHTSEQIVGYNEDGKTLVRICTSKGSPASSTAFGSNCVLELRDYGRITKTAETVNIISTEKR